MLSAIRSATLVARCTVCRTEDWKTAVARATLHGQSAIADLDSGIAWTHHCFGIAWTHTHERIPDDKSLKMVTCQSFVMFLAIFMFFNVFMSHDESAAADDNHTQQDEHQQWRLPFYAPVMVVMLSADPWLRNVATIVRTTWLNNLIKTSNNVSEAITWSKHQTEQQTWMTNTWLPNGPMLSVHWRLVWLSLTSHHVLCKSYTARTHDLVLCSHDTAQLFLWFRAWSYATSWSDEQNMRSTLGWAWCQPCVVLLWRLIDDNVI